MCSHYLVVVCVCVLSLAQLFVTPWTAAHRLLCPWGSQTKLLEQVATSTPGNPLNIGINPAFPLSPALQADSSLLGKTLHYLATWEVLSGFYSQIKRLSSDALDSLVSPDFRGGSLPCNLISLLGPRKVIDFQFVQYFSCKDGSDDFQALCMLELKLEIQDRFSTDGAGTIEHLCETKKNLDSYLASI